jgi:PTS system N-acetylgalactosamine-specific IIA component
MTSSAPDPGADARPVGPVAVVAAHGDLAAGLVSAVAQITGQGALLAAMSNRGRGPAELEAELRALVDAAPVRAVFTDLPGGSCTMAARRVQRDRPGLALATGVNLAALLDFVCSAVAAEDTDPAAAPDATAATMARALDRGRASIMTLGAPPLGGTEPRGTGGSEGTR